MRVFVAILLCVLAMFLGCNSSNDANPSGTASALSQTRLEQLTRSARAGDTEAQLELAQRYDSSEGVQQNASEAFSWYLKAAESGVIPAMTEVARRYRDSRGVRRDYDKAKHWWSIAAEKGDPEAQLEYAHSFGGAARYGAFINGNSKEEVKRNADQFVEWLEKAAAQNHARAKYELAMTLILGAKEVFSEEKALYVLPPNNKERGLVLLRESADGGYWEAEIAMASLYQVGYAAIQPDKQKSAEYWKKLLQHTDAITLRLIGTFYREYSARYYVDGKNKYAGRALNFNETNKIALEWFEKASAKDDPDANYELAKMFTEGIGVLKDEQRGLELYRRAAALGHYGAQRHLAYAYVDGKGVVRDYAEAFKWFSQAANEDESGSWSEVHKMRNALGVFYEYAYGVDKDLVLAYAWYNIAAAGGYEKAKQNRSRVEKNLTSDDLREAQELSKEWIPGQALVRRGTPAIAEAKSVPTHGLKLAGVGSGFVVSSNGHILTNQHVIDHCSEIRLPADRAVARHVVSDQANDLAVVKVDATDKPGLRFQSSDDVQQGEEVFVFGFPLDGYLPAAGNITIGIVSALAGPGNNSSLVQMTAPVQPGNSGGPLLNKKGSVVGIVVGKADAIKIAKATGDIPQNINFAIASRTVKSFLDGNKIPYETQTNAFALNKDTIAIADVARKSTVKLECWK